MLCAGCPHRGIFYALTKFDVIVTGDIGCYSLGVFAPLERIDTFLCMCGVVSIAHGMNRAGEPRPVVGMVVITSYSIHYTKLYDITVDPVAVSRQCNEEAGGTC